ncbi:hypothetical protein [Methylobacterium planeticum]|uniref:hypothetical protein n=1 Tax=Methylobacterium planeticum TaxID=2615211 RepID=UPI0017832468|nr:hypothetical protein [Methylobacterium planeticum]
MTVILIAAMATAWFAVSPREPGMQVHASAGINIAEMMKSIRVQPGQAYDAF